MKHLLSLSILLSASLNVFASWDGTSTIWTQGTGSESDPYLIENEQHLAFLQKSVNEGVTYEGKCFLLTTDLDMSGKIFNPIGIHDDYILENEIIEESKPFLGTFDGAYFTIDNVIIELAEEDEYEIGGVGLFALGRSSTFIKNLRLGENVVINANGSPMTGSVMGVSYGSTIENCSFAGKLNGGTVETGGILGRAESGSKLRGCINSGDITGNSFSGGIVGSTEIATISDCLFSGSLNGNMGYWIGGIIGWALNSTLSSSVSIGNILGETGSTYMPGISPICAELEKTTASNCFYVETLTGCKPSGKQEGVIALSETEIKTEETIAILNNGEEGGWILSPDNGYPTLRWTLSSEAGIKSFQYDNNIEIKNMNGLILIKAKNAEYSLFDISGKILSSGLVKDQILLSPNYKGIGIVRVRTSEGQEKTLKIKL